MPPIIKLPPIYDISHWKEVRDFKLVLPRPVLFITKATEAAPNTGYSGHTDGKFVRFFEGMMEIEVLRGAFHFMRKTVDPVRQAKHFVDTVSKVDILPTDYLILDMEETGETAPRMWAWCDYVMKSFPENELIIYSRKGLLDLIKMTEAEKAFFRKIKTWSAGYPTYPDNFKSIPLAYTPDQTKWGPTALWQYSSHGRVDGITTELGAPTDVDLNLASPAFQVALQGRLVIGEKVMANYTGKATTVPAKVWKSIGGAEINRITVLGTAIKADAEQTVSGVKYLHLTSPFVGWSKAQWFQYSPVTTPPPPPPPDPEPTEDKVEIYVNGTLKYTITGKIVIS